MMMMIDDDDNNNNNVLEVSSYRVKPTFRFTLGCHGGSSSVFDI